MMDVAEALVGGNIAAGARAIRWLDDRDPRGAEVIRSIFQHTGKAQVVGMTGPPGSGKSTLTDGLVREFRRMARRVAVVAIDPTSPLTGGAILGDRVRMAQHALDPDVFVRSLGTRGAVGGLSRATHDTCLVLDAMGFDPVIVETLGVGQDELDIVRLAHTTVILGVPGMGDEVQAMKAGLMEMGEIFVINKADREGLESTLRQLELMLHLRQHSGPDNGWTVPLLSAIASRGEGTSAVADAIVAHGDHLRAHGSFEHRSAFRAREQTLNILRERLLEHCLGFAGDKILREVEAGAIDPYTAAQEVLDGSLRKDAT